MTMTVHCDEDRCGWSDTVSRMSHLRAWYRAACPLCGIGEIIDATEVRLSEEMIAMERVGLVAVHEGGDPGPGMVVMHVDTASEQVVSVTDCEYPMGTPK